MEISSTPFEWFFSRCNEHTATRFIGNVPVRNLRNSASLKRLANWYVICDEHYVCALFCLNIMCVLYVAWRNPMIMLFLKTLFESGITFRSNNAGRQPRTSWFDMLVKPKMFLGGRWTAEALILLGSAHLLQTCVDVILELVEVLARRLHTAHSTQPVHQCVVLAVHVTVPVAVLRHKHK